MTLSIEGDEIYNIKGKSKALLTVKPKKDATGLMLDPCQITKSFLALKKEQQLLHPPETLRIGKEGGKNGCKRKECVAVPSLHP